MKKVVVIGILSIVAIIIAGCTQQIKESTPGNSEIQKNAYGQQITECEVLSAEGDGDTVCINNGYSVCIEQMMPSETTYYDSIDGSCSGATQLVMDSLIPQSCGRTEGGAACGTNDDPNVAEPYRGDVRSENLPAKYVTCCK